MTSPSLPSRNWTLAVVSLATAMLMLDIAVVNTALPSIASDLNTGLSGLQWVVDAYTLTLASAVLSAGFLADRLGRRRLFVIGLTLFTGSSIAAAASGSIEALVAARAFQGLGAAILFAVALALLANAFQDSKGRQFAIAVWGATIGASFAVGPLAGGALTSYLSWQWIFLVNVPIGAVALWITLTKVRESRDPHPRSLDVAGQVALIAGMFLLVLGLLRGNDVGWSSPQIVLELAGAAVAWIAFLVIEHRGRQPMLPLGLFRNPVFAGTQISVFAISASLFAVYLYVTIYLQNVLGLSAIQAGLVLVPGTVVNFVTAGASASFIPKMKPRTPVAVGLGLVAIGLALMTLANENSSWTVTLPGMLVAMVGTGMVNTSLSGLALSVLPERESGLASGIHDTFRQGGIAVGIAALGTFIPHAAGLGSDPVAFVDGLQKALLAGAGVAAVGAVLANVLIRPERRSAQVPAGAEAATAAA